MIIQDITIKNLLSYGEQATKVDFTRHPTTLICGKNGQGKSSIYEALTFVLFGKAFRDIKKDQLINNINKKNCLVECNLISNNGTQVKIRRGLKPNLFEIYENGKLVDQHAEVKEYQNYLENNIIGMNYIIFSQTVIISKTKYTPFMKLRAGERRQFVESILNLELFGDMLKTQTKNLSILKTKENDFKTDIKIETTKMSGYVESYRRITSLYEKAKKESQIEREKEIEFFNEKSILLIENNDKLSSQLMTDNPYLKKYNKSIQLKNKKQIITNNIEKLKSDIIKYEKNKSSKCHVCGSDVDISHIEKHIKELTKEINEKKSLIDIINNGLNDLSTIDELYNNHEKEQAVIKSKINNNKDLLMEYNNKIREYQNKKDDFSSYIDDIKELKSKTRESKKTLETYNDALKDVLKDIETNSFVLSLLKDSGIKSSIIQNSIPYINSIINEYLHKFGFYINFELDSEFDETITIRGAQDMSYNNFSEGEKLRVDLALIMAWRQIGLVKSGTTCNLLFFDEITDASMDIEGVELFAKSLSVLKDSNIWIISHTPEKLEQYMRGFIYLDKIDGFTTISTNK